MKKSGIFAGKGIFRGNSYYKRAQVTIFIILAIVIVAGIAMVYFLTRNPSVEVSPSKDPQKFIEQCIQQNVDEALPQILSHGGLISPSNNPEKSVLYEDKYISFLCYSEEIQTICTQNTPLLKAQIEEQLKIATEDNIRECFNILKGEFSGYEYSETPLDYFVNITPTELIVRAIKNIKISSADSSQEFNSFSYRVSSPVFDFVILTNKILNDEVDCDCGNEACRADVLALSKANTDFEITLFVGGNDDEVYKIKDIQTEQQFKFAVRNCVN